MLKPADSKNICFFDDINTERQTLWGLKVLHKLIEIPKDTL